jgi:glycosyltransferase involved in cell wall biosynthesis
MTKISLCITVKNESANIEELLVSVVGQTRLPDEVVMIDGGSTDQTVELVRKFSSSKLGKKIAHWQLKSEKLNISQGRNLAISLAKNGLIAITDAGCVLESSWLSELELCFTAAQSKQKSEVVVAGYYRGAPQSSFEAAVVPYVLVMPDQVQAESFLPATRSMLLPKKIWQAVGGFDESLQVSEDFAFAHAVVKKYGQQQIVFCPSAVVRWRPRSNLKSFYTMIFKMAESDIRAGIYRGKVKLLFGRYAGGLLILLATLKSGHPKGWLILVVGIVGYLIWSVLKNKKYVGAGWLWLPALQLTADVAVMHGSLSGLLYDQSKK